MKTLVAVVAALVLLACLADVALGDIYMHNPRGSNNRLNEQSANRNNGNRLFDSQNNNRGGYNVGDKGNNAFNGNAPYNTGSNQLNVETSVTEMYEEDNNKAIQYQMVFFEGSILPVEWTNQHGCGGNEATDPHKLNCQMVIQYACDTKDNAFGDDNAMKLFLRDGGNTNTPNAPGNANDITNTANNNDNNVRGRHENEYYYYECDNRNRNRGLFLADQNPNSNDARRTRQNPNGNRSGLECPEERDYYPYWHPTPWLDIAVLTSNPEQCPSILANSNNNNTHYKCFSADYDANKVKPNNKAECEEAEGTWIGRNHGIPGPVCRQGDWTRSNHLGNGRNGQPLTFNWTLPLISELSPNTKTYTDTPMARCVLRIRYNISTDDYDPFNTNATHNDDPNNGVRSPVTNNPTVDVGAGTQGLQLAINTNQFGRTFQDRSHVFYIRKRPAAFEGKKLYNINVRGKRGNIVQTYPSVEYDFQPSALVIDDTDLVHWQWTGSNTHNNGNNAGDGQAGDAGQGQGGTDRNNVLQLLGWDKNYPIPYDKFTTNNLNMFKNAKCYRPGTGALVANVLDCQLSLATAGYYTSVASAANKAKLDDQMNNGYASFRQGIVMQFSTNNQEQATFHYMCSRNNNFTNRSQKAWIKVNKTTPPA